MVVASDKNTDGSKEKAALVALEAQKKDIRNRWLLSLPALSIIFFAAAGPMAIVVLYSFLVPGDYTGVKWIFTTENWFNVILERDIFDDNLVWADAHLTIFWRSVKLSLLTTVLTAIFGIPTAYFIATRSNRSRNLWLFLITIPFWTNLLIRTFAWIIILGKDGVIENTFSFVGIINDEDSLNLMYTNTAILIGLVYSYIPLMVLPIYSSMEKLDVRLIEAASDLYSNRINLILKVILPLTLPGIIGGSILVFVPSLGAFIAPDLLGGGKKLLLGSLIQFQFAYARNWPFGAAIAMVLLSVIIIILYLNARINKRHEQLN